MKARVLSAFGVLATICYSLMWIHIWKVPNIDHMGFGRGESKSSVQSMFYSGGKSLKSVDDIKKAKLKIFIYDLPDKFHKDIVRHYLNKTSFDFYLSTPGIPN